MIDIEIGDIWRTKRSPVDCEVTDIDFSGDFTRITSYSKSDDVTDTCTYGEFLRDYEFIRKADKTDMVNEPPHYKDASGVGCTEVVKHMMFFGGSCFKYLYRCGNKWGDIGDLKKAVRCAELADDDRFITDESWLRAMYQVASHRDGNIQQAMFNIRSQQWEYVIEYIKAEIARLEANQ